MFKFTTWTFPLSSLFSVFCSVTEGRTLLSFLQMLSPLRTRGNGFRLKEGGLDWIKGKSYLWEGQCSSGTGCPEMRWVPHPCRQPRSGDGLWALLELWVSLLSAGGGTRWPLRVPSNPNRSMIPWLFLLVAYSSHPTLPGAPEKVHAKRCPPAAKVLPWCKRTQVKLAPCCVMVLAACKCGFGSQTKNPCSLCLDVCCGTY